ncbi:HAD family hydrolase [Falsibacillus pallidus]|uniref:Putative hydrolase of the HAD superfamily n=1 Tax=Falsibacillus pallidus TaxID=493781 RepID=A0A370GQ91_9BACI|nr:HAD family hydrolase [Falsibacillus pallidus]RDI45416.1 putative hydrolase of the HAD superfamily [Falsibacillus pallidus]
MIKAVIFDLYETLITEWENGEQKYTKRLIDIGMNESLFNKEWSKRREERMNGTFPDFYSCMEDIFNKNGIVPDKLLLEKHFNERVKAKEKAFENSDQNVLDMLGKLKKRGLKIGLISNCSPEEVAAWAGSPIAAFVDEAIFSYQTGYAKPDLEIYQLACKKMGVEPSECIFIGDNGSDELNGAKKAGMHPFHAKWFSKHWNNEKYSDYQAINEPKEILDLLFMSAEKGESI